MIAVLLIVLATAIVCGVAGFIQHKQAIRQLKRDYQDQIASYQKYIDTYREVLATIRRERMLFTRHPKFRETANAISRLLS